MLFERIVKSILIDLAEIMLIVRTFRIHTFVDSKVFAVFDVNKGMLTVRTSEGIGLGETVFVRREHRGTDLAADLSFGTIVLIKKGLWSIAARAGAVIMDIAFGTSVNRFDLFAVFPFEIRDIVFIVPGFVVDDFWELVDLELLIFWRMRIIESPLSERDISADKI